MKLTVTVKLQPTPEQVDALRQTLLAANAAANAISAYAWKEQTFGQYQLHKLLYYPIRATSGLSAQVVVRLFAKVADAYKLDHKRQRVFRPLGSIAFDERILSWGRDTVSIWTVAGRQRIPFLCDERARRLLTAQQGETDLIYRDGQWYLATTVNYTEPPPGEADDLLGVDLGITNIATDSDGHIYSGKQVNGLRRRHARLRAKLQRKGTRAAKRLLHKRRRKETRFASWVNHNLSKKLVTHAKDTQRAIALEDLKGIRVRITVRKAQRRIHHSWAFYQLRSFIEYKARMVGVPVVLVDPRNTSRTCPAYGCIDKANRPSQSKFLCVQCGFAGLADHIAAMNIRSRAAVNRPDLTAGSLLGPQASPVESPAL
jgi:IS605 OrfB family transposase